MFVWQATHWPRLPTSGLPALNPAAGSRPGHDALPGHSTKTWQRAGRIVQDGLSVAMKPA
jgi:hypothetical protein